MKLKLVLNPKSEIRNPKEIRSPKSENGKGRGLQSASTFAEAKVTPCSMRSGFFTVKRRERRAPISDFGFRSSFGFREFGFRISVLFLCLLSPQRIHAAELHPTVTAWLRAQTNFHTWSADVTQTRSLKSLTQPLISTGKVWFAAPNHFHWELGQPVQTIAVRQPEQMLVIYPRLKRVEKYPLGESAGPWRDALALLEAGFPRDEAELQSRFNIESVETKNGVCELTMQPKSSAARKMMSQIKIAFGTNDFLLRATELQFADGSTMRNDFTNGKMNEPIAEKLFSPELPADWKIVEPLKK